MKEGKFLSTYQISEARTLNVNRIILLPYGYVHNFGISNATIGDIVHFKDGKESVIEEICTVTTFSPIFNLLCKMVYGLPATDVVKKWRIKYKNDIQYDHALVITYSSLFTLCKS